MQGHDDHLNPTTQTTSGFRSRLRSRDVFRGSGGNYTERYVSERNSIYERCEATLLSKPPLQGEVAPTRLATEGLLLMQHPNLIADQPHSVPAGQRFLGETHLIRLPSAATFPSRGRLNKVSVAPQRIYSEAAKCSLSAP